MGKVRDNNSYSHILKYTGIFGGVQGLNILVGLVRNKFTAIFLGTSGMGLLALFNSTLSFLSSSCNFGIPTSGVRVVAESHSKVCLVRSVCLLSALLGVVVCLVIGGVLDFFASSSVSSMSFASSVFSDSFGASHSLHFLFLASTVFFTILAGGEMAILKGLGKLRQQAILASVLALLSLLFSVPIYGCFGERGIMAVLFLLAFSQWLLCFLSLRRVVPFRLRFSRRMLIDGLPMIRMGGSFVVSGMMASGAELLVRAFIGWQGNLSDVGLFNAGVTIVLVYAGMIFSVMDADYYPRLSAVGGSRKGTEAVKARNAIINRQLEVNVLLAVPVVLLLVVFLPYLLPLLYNRDFMGVLGMAQVASVGLLFKAIYLPIEYIPLSRGDAKVFLVQESCAVLLLVVSEIGGYLLFGLTGIGAGILVAYLLESIGVFFFSRRYYGCRISLDGCRRLVRIFRITLQR